MINNKLIIEVDTNRAFLVDLLNNIANTSVVVIEHFLGTINIERILDDLSVSGKVSIRGEDKNFHLQDLNSILLTGESVMDLVENKLQWKKVHLSFKGDNE